MPTRLQKITSTIVWSSVSILAIYFAGRHLLFGWDYSFVSKAQSPNGLLTIHEFQSIIDGFGHAPYGTILAISPKPKIRSPEEGYVFFAGYCQSSISYEWKDDKRISVRCIEGSGGNGPRTLASVAYGVNVNYLGQ